jgi:hypothetical protein
MTYTSTVREHTMTVGENFPSTGQDAACGGAGVAESVALLTCPPDRSRLLRAAWRPCSRGSARRAAVAANGS